MGRLFLLTFVLGCAPTPGEPQKPQREIAGDATCAQTMICYQDCGPRNVTCDRMCGERATVQAQHDSATLMRCLFDHVCYDQKCVDTFCATELAICRPNLAPVSAPLVSR